MNHWLPAEDSPDDVAQAWFLRLHSGDATQDELAQLRAWLDADPAHRDAFTRADAVWHGVQSFGPTMAKLYGEHAGPRRQLETSGSRWPLLGGALAAAAAIALVGVTALTSGATADLHTSVGEIVRTTLPDGTIAWLDTDSALNLRFDDDERRIELLRGQAWFDVHENARPFIVQALDGTVTDVGTFFGVRLDDERVNVSVARGAVQIDQQDRRLFLDAGQGAQFGHDIATTGPVRLDPDALAWQSGRLVFEGVPLSEVLAEMDRYRPGHILLLGRAAGRRRVSAILAVDNLEGGLDALAATQNVRITRLTDYLIVVTDGG